MHPAAREIAARLRVSDSEEERNQLRRELCLAMGIHPDDIDPNTGHNISRAAYERVRAEWRDLYAKNRGSDRTKTNLRLARHQWETRRPEWTREDPWVEEIR